jgi:hypothetical protein
MQDETEHGDDADLVPARRKPRKGIYILPNLVTLAALFGGFYAIVMAMNGRFDLAATGVFCAMVLFSTQADLRSAAEIELIDWLQNRHDFNLGFENNADAVDRATAADPRDLPQDQANIAMWLSRKYRVAPEPISALVAEAFDIAPRNRLDPTLILAVMAIESSFNPFAQSSVGAQGLMQVRTKVHTEKFHGVCPTGRNSAFASEEASQDQRTSGHKLTDSE